MEKEGSKPGQDNARKIGARSIGARMVGFLVVDGSKVVVIDKPVVNIGRKSDNHIVINEEHVSRYHAQVRMFKGQFAIMDLNSTVGTSVNGEQIDQVLLNPGDVISLGGVPIIFGMGAPSAEFESLDTTSIGNSAPTESTEINSADKYLNFFNTDEDSTP